MKDTPLSHFAYTIKDNKIELKRYIKNSKVVNIPETYIINNKKYQVAYISSHCFSNKNLEEIRLPNTISEIKNYAFRDCHSLKKINIPKDIQLIKRNVFPNDIKLPNFENNCVKIRNNNIFEKEGTENGIIYQLVQSMNNVLELEENEYLCNNIHVPNKIIIKGSQKQFEVYKIRTRKIDTIIAPNIEEFLLDYENILEINNLFLSNKIKSTQIETLPFNDLKIKNIYFNGTKEEYDNKLLEDFYYIDINNIVLKKEINELLNENYTYAQINQITRGYQKNILLSNIDPDYNEFILRDIVNNFECTDFELYTIYNLLKECNLENELQIQNMIQNKITDRKEEKGNDMYSIR